MILKALTLENFKGIGEPVRIEFAPLTLLFGPNNAGKSTILHALQFTAALLKAPGLDPFDASAAAGSCQISFSDLCPMIASYASAIIMFGTWGWV